VLTAFFAVMYIYRKGPIAGPYLKMPFIGPFLESMNPKFQQYQAKWASGDLSCVSVFHKYAFLAGDECKR
jgi:sterol 22-desaturase